MQKTFLVLSLFCLHTFHNTCSNKETLLRLCNLIFFKELLLELWIHRNNYEWRCSSEYFVPKIEKKNKKVESDTSMRNWFQSMRKKNVDYTGKQISKGFTSNQELSVHDSQCFTRPTNMFMKFYQMHVEEGLSVCVCIYLYAFILVYI